MLIEQKVKNIWVEYLEKKSEKDYTTLYIHTPYCSQKCFYCEYFSKIAPGVPESCIDYLEKQFEEAAPYFEKEKIKAINFGGGTPNMMSPRQLDRVLKMVDSYWHLEKSWENEMGFEFNPHHLSDEHMSVLKSSYINRLSMGVQSFNPEILKLENRLYTSPEIVQKIYNDSKSFTKMMNVDLLAGLFNQTTETLLRDVKFLLDIGVEAITIYELNRVNGRNNKESERKYIENMLIVVNQIFKNYPNYRWVGTDETHFEHCNRLYKNTPMYEFPYNPAPQGYNNVIAFSLDDDNIKIYPVLNTFMSDRNFSSQFKSMSHATTPQNFLFPFIVL